MKEYIIETNTGINLKKWFRTSFIDDKGQVYLPCGACGNEESIYLCMVYDGVKAIRHRGHIYAPTRWLMKEYPKFKNAIETMQREILRRN